jgi:hypothetical protein
MFGLFRKSVSNAAAMKALDIGSSALADQYFPVPLSRHPDAFRAYVAQRVQHEYLSETNGRLTTEDAAAIKLVLMYQFVEQAGQSDLISAADEGLDAFRAAHGHQLSPGYSLAVMGRSI